MRRHRLLLVVVAFFGIGVLATCSKKSSAPNAPPSQPPSCALSAIALSFGSVGVGSSTELQFTLTNNGGGTLSGTVSESCAEFSLVGATTYSLGAGASATFTVRFSPATAGAKSCTIATGSTACSAVTCSGTGAAIAGSCGVSPTSLDFGTVPLGQTVDRTFRVRNLGQTTLTGAVTETCDDFSIPGSASYQLTPGDSSTFIVRFTPTQGGVLGCIVNTGSAACSNISCTAVGQEVCAVAPTTIDFGVVTVGQSKDTTFTIENIGPTFLVGSVSSPCDGFSLPGATSYNLGPGESRTITLRFAPSIAAGLYTCMVQTGTGCAAISARGEARFPQTAANCLVSPTSLDFGEVVVGESQTKIFQIRNGYRAGGPQLSGDISISGADFFGGYHYIVDPEHVLNVQIVFSPSTLGPHSGEVTISQTGCSYCGASCTSVSLSGTGITTPPPVLCGVSTNTMDMGTVYFGQSKDTTFSITNVGGGTMSGSVALLDNSPPFSLVGPTTYALGAGQSQTFTIRFSSSGTPGHTYSYVGNIDTGAQCMAQGLGIQVMAVARETPPPPPVCQVTPDSLKFGSVLVGQSQDLAFQVRNVGGGLLAGQVASTCSEFALVGPVNQFYLGAGQSATFTIRFAPSSKGPKQCGINVGGCLGVIALGDGL